MLYFEGLFNYVARTNPFGGKADDEKPVSEKTSYHAAAAVGGRVQTVTREQLPEHLLEAVREFEEA